MAQVHTDSTAIRAREKAKQPDKALELLAGMLQKRLGQTSSRTCSRSAHVCGPISVMVLILEIWQKGLEANVIAHDAAISAIESAKQPDEAMTLLGDVAEGPGSRGDHLHATISASEKAKQSDKATELCAGMQHNGLEPDGITHNAVVTAGEKARQPDKALELLAEMQLRGLGSDVITYNAAIIACDKAKQPPEAMSSLRGCS